MSNPESFDSLVTRSLVMPPEFRDLRAAREAAQDRFLSRENVVGVGLGNKTIDGVTGDVPCIVVLVSSKRPESLLDNRDRISRTVENVATDVLEVGHLFAGQSRAAGLADPLSRLNAQTLATRVRPVRPGFSVGHFKITAGTIGGACYDAAALPGKPTKYYILSNNHVLANSNAATVGDPIYQPGPYDGGVAADAVGKLSRFIPITFNGSCNEVDAAIAEVPFDTIERSIYWIGCPTSAAEPATVGQLLKKTGRTTHFTTGKVTVIAATVNVNYGNGQVAKFCNQIVTTDMSAGGDSGSLVLDAENRPVGLLFAGSSQATILNPIGLVQAALNVRLWP